MVSCHIETRVRLRSRAVTTTRTSDGPSASRTVAIVPGLDGPRYSIEMTTVPDAARTSSTKAVQRGRDPPRLGASAWRTARAWSAHTAPGTSTPASASRGLSAKSSAWR